MPGTVTSSGDINKNESNNLHARNDHLTGVTNGTTNYTTKFYRLPQRGTQKYHAAPRRE